MAFTMLWLLALFMGLTVQAKPENDDDLYSFITVSSLFSLFNSLFSLFNCFLCFRVLIV